jgi:hypothetical protein
MLIVTALRPRNKNVPAASRVDRLVHSRCVDLAVQDLTPSPELARRVEGIVPTETIEALRAA